MATTTSVYDSGLLGALIPEFESSHAVRVDVLAVGSGQALALAERGDADLLLVHDPVAEQTFLHSGNGQERFPLMWNEFVLVGPPDDPAGARQAESVPQAFRAIAGARSLFLSRGDNSGTHARERQIWQRAGVCGGGGPAPAPSDPVARGGDPYGAGRLEDIIRDVRAERSTAVVLVSHDLFRPGAWLTGWAFC